MPVFSNQLKALLVLEDITEQGVSVWQNNCFTVQHYHYLCRRERNDAGIPYGRTVPSFLEFTIRVAAADSAKTLMERMQSQESFPFSFVFNASFAENRRLSDWEDAMVVRGYLVDVEETYDKTQAEAGAQEQMLIKGRLLLSNLAYVGRERVMKLTITKD